MKSSTKTKIKQPQYMDTAEYRKKFYAKLRRLISAKKEFTADDFRSIGNVNPRSIGGIWSSALSKHDLVIVGYRPSKAPSRKGAYIPIYKAA